MNQTEKNQNLHTLTVIHSSVSFTIHISIVKDTTISNFEKCRL